MMSKIIFTLIALEAIITFSWLIISSIVDFVSTIKYLKLHKDDCTYEEDEDLEKAFAYAKFKLEAQKSLNN